MHHFHDRGGGLPRNVIYDPVEADDAPDHYQKAVIIIVAMTILTTAANAETATVLAARGNMDGCRKTGCGTTLEAITEVMSPKQTERQ